jgi:hypothetical protein
MISFVALLLLALAPSAFTLDLEVYIPLQKVDLFERLGLNNESTAQGALEDGRLDAIMALGGDMYTAQLGVGQFWHKMNIEKIIFKNFRHSTAAIGLCVEFHGRTDLSECW